MSEEKEKEITLESVLTEVHRWTIIVGNLVSDVLNPLPEKKDLPNKDKENG